MNDVKEMVYKLTVWLLTAIVSASTYVIYNIHADVDRHNGEFASRWTSSFYDTIVEDIRYPLIHEEYRELYVTQNEVFHEDIRQFMASRGGLSEADHRALETRVRQLEQNCAVLMARPTRVGGRNYYHKEDDFNASED